MTHPRRADSAAPSGFVSLVGAGPGDPELLTVKGMRRLREADIVAYDRLVNPALLRECRPRAELIYVGKHGDREGRASVPQEAINRLLVEKARAGLRTVRLKGGDPFVFGRGGEEALDLRAAGVPFEIVPGVSSALAVPAYAGIPVTHRGVASTLAIVAGHEDPGKARSSLDWAALATGVDTLVVLMALGRLETIVHELLRHGRAAATPAAVVRWGSTPEQETLTATLATIADEVREAGLQPPATLVVGEVVALRQQLRWFEAAPLGAVPSEEPERLDQELREVR